MEGSDEPVRVPSARGAARARFHLLRAPLLAWPYPGRPRLRRCVQARESAALNQTLQEMVGLAESLDGMRAGISELMQHEQLLDMQLSEMRARAADTFDAEMASSMCARRPAPCAPTCGGCACRCSLAAWC